MPAVHANHDIPPTATRWSIVLAAGAGGAVGREALAWLCRQYWDVLARHARRKGWDEAEDAIQDFFARLIERGAIAQADPARGRFRSWLLTSLDHFLANRAQAGGAMKRGGGRPDVVMPEDHPVEPGRAEDQAFIRDWALTLLAQAEDRLAREQQDDQRFALLRPFLMAAGDAAAYRKAGDALHLGEGAVKVAVHRLRARLTVLIREAIGDSLAEPDPRCIDHELDVLISALAGPSPEQRL